MCIRDRFNTGQTKSVWRLKVYENGTTEARQMGPWSRAQLAARSALRTEKSDTMAHPRLPPKLWRRRFEHGPAWRVVRWLAVTRQIRCAALCLQPRMRTSRYVI